MSVGLKLLAKAKTYLYMHEKTHNSVLKNLLNLNPAKIAWCARFINSLLEEMNIQGTNSNLARSFLKMKNAKKVVSPKKGDIVIFKRGLPWQGHVSIFIRETPTHVYCLGGNQANSVCIKAYQKRKVIGYRRL
tara:strand:- start:6612 stop:7010 length:399 start_codon:yes stop_codon:yes gene_type:complete